MYDLDYHELAPMFDDTYNGPDPSETFLDDYWNSQPQSPENVQQWQIDAALELVDTVLQDQRINDLLYTYDQTPNPPEHVTNLVVNQTSQWIAENAEAGAYDEILTQYEDMAGQASAWESANGFSDPFLDWGLFDHGSFWRDDGPSWWGDEYGLY